MTGIEPLRHLTDQLEQAAEQLRGARLEPQQAARLVEECARLAGEAAAELDRRARAAADAPAPVQDAPGTGDRPAA
jgi:hypothetical protein